MAPKVQALFICDEATRGRDDTIDVRGAWQLKRVRKFPYELDITAVALFSGEFVPQTVSIALVDVETGQQIGRDVTNPPVGPVGKAMTMWSCKVPPFEVLAPCRLAIKIDADGISPVVYEFELVKA